MRLGELTLLGFPFAILYFFTGLFGIRFSLCHTFGGVTEFLFSYSWHDIIPF